jgi:acetyl esterase/lipase
MHPINMTLCCIVFAATLPNHLSFAATTDTPAARDVIEQYGNTYQGTQIAELRAIYKRHLTDAGFETANVTRDLSYGPHARHKLDVLQPRNQPDELMPVLVFIHGGAFVRGNRSDGELFDNVLNYFTARGVLGINATYRLAPEYQWPSGVEDMRAIMDWVGQNATKFGGDPDKIFLIGHSAGASHIAGYTFNEDFQPEDGTDGLRGAILMSGVYSPGESAANTAYYGDDKERWAKQMPMHHVPGRSVPLFIIDAEYDRLLMQVEAVKLMNAVCQRDSKCPMHKQLAGHNHFSMMYHINTADDSVASDIMVFITEYSAD